MLVDLILEAATAKASNREPTRKMGAHNALKCFLANWLMLHGYPAEPMQGRSELNFTIGDLVEQSVIDWLIAAGVPGIRKADYEKDKIQVPELQGRVIADLFWTNEGREWPAEIKSMADFTFERAERGELDETYLGQAEVYCRAYDVPYVPVICYKKVTSHLHEVIVQRDDARWAKIIRHAEIARGPTRPERPYKLQILCDGCKGTGKTPTGRQDHKACGGSGRVPGGPIIPNFPCGYCSYKSSCWNDLGVLEQFYTESGAPRWRLAGVRAA